MKQVMMGEATGGPTSSTLREGRGKSLGEQRWTQKEMVLCRIHLLRDFLGAADCWLLTADSPADTWHSMHLN